MVIIDADNLEFCAVLKIWNLESWDLFLLHGSCLLCFQTSPFLSEEKLQIIYFLVLKFRRQRLAFIAVSWFLFISLKQKFNYPFKLICSMYVMLSFGNSKGYYFGTGNQRLFQYVSLIQLFYVWYSQTFCYFSIPCYTGIFTVQELFASCWNSWSHCWHYEWNRRGHFHVGHSQFS